MMELGLEIDDLERQIVRAPAWVPKASIEGRREAIRELEAELTDYQIEMNRKRRMVEDLDSRLGDVRTLILNLKHTEDISHLEKEEAEILAELEKLGAPINDEREWCMEDEDYAFAQNGICNHCGSKTCTPDICCNGCGSCAKCRYE